MSGPIGVPALESVEQVVVEGTFEEALTALESVVDHLERSRLSLDQAMAWYEVGLRLSRRCSDLLEQSELRVRLLAETYGSTTMEQVRPLEDDE